LLITDDPTSFAERVVYLMRDRERRREMGLAARRLVEARHDWRHIVPLLEQVYEE
jgi:glycosyltransferase involved in cell wall biosynthesis